MRIVTDGSEPTLNIKDKNFRLFRYHEDQKGKVFFLQVSGSAPLRKEDFPSKDWALFRKQRGNIKVDTAYFKPWFRYDLYREHATLAFVGNTAEGAMVLAFRYLAQRAKICLPVHDLLERASAIQNEKMPYWLTLVPNQGSAKSAAILLELTPWLEDKEVKTLLTEKVSTTENI